MPKKSAPKVIPAGRLVPLLAIALVLTLSIFAYFTWLKSQSVSSEKKVQTPATVEVAAPVNLPKPSLTSRMSLEATLQARRSRRDFTADALNLRQVGQMLWSAQGVTADWGGRTTPSAKSAYPLTVYLAAYNVVDLAPGIYTYLPGKLEAAHQIQLLKKGDFRAPLAEAIGQNAAANPPALLIISGDMEVMAKAFDNVRHDNNVYLEAGHAAQNLYLEAESLRLGLVTIAGFDGAKVAGVAGIPSNEIIIYAIPFGVPKP